MTVSVDDGQGGKDSQTFVATTVIDPSTNNDPPILGPVGDQTTSTGTTFTVTLSSTDLEGDAPTYGWAQIPDPPTGQLPNLNPIKGNVLTLTPGSSFKGVAHLLLGVQQSNGNTRWDKQQIAVTVKDQVITPTAVDLTGSTGTSISGPVATFTAAVPFAVASFSAQVDWGDGNTSAGTLSQNSDGSYTVSGSHTYSTAQTYSVTTKITDNPSKISASVSGSAQIAFTPPNGNILGLSQSPVTGLFSGKLAKFTGVDPTAALSDFSALISWGDNTKGAGTLVKESDGSFTVSGTHGYSKLGYQGVSVTLSQNGNDLAIASGSLLVTNLAPTLDPIGPQTVAEGSTLKLTALGYEKVSGQTLAYSLAAGAPAGAEINAVTGVLTWTPASGPASASFTVVATSSGTPALTASQTFTVTVTAVAPTVTLDPSQSARQFDLFKGSGRFNDTGVGPWAATVDYGDGTGSTPLSLGSNHQFTLSHVYVAAGTFTVTVTVTDPTGLKGFSTLAVAVAPAPVVYLSATSKVVKKAITSFNILATGPLDPASVSNLANYSLVSAGKDKKFGTKDDVKTALKSLTYSAGQTGITLTLAKGLIPTGTLQFQISGLRDTHGRPVPTFLASVSKAGAVKVISS